MIAGYDGVGLLEVVGLVGQVVPQSAEHGVDDCPPLCRRTYGWIASQVFASWMAFQLNQFRRQLVEGPDRHQS